MNPKINQRIKLLIFVLLLIPSQAYYIQEGFNPSKIITNFTFGSNYYGRYSEDENIFKTIITHNPNLWIWLGNAVYLRKPEFNFLIDTPETLDWDYIKYLYQKVKNNEYYKKLKEKVPILGIWGDEEYGILNGDERNNYKESYKQYYLDFLEADILDQRRNRINTGLYSTYSFGSGYKTVRFILLDLKYNKSSFLKDDEKDEMLGEDQWNWLENIFIQSKETYTFICISNQILSFRYTSYTNKWYEESRKKLLNLIGKYKRNGVIFLSGELGFTQILKTFCPLPEIGYNLYECTSSGLSHSNKLSSLLNNLYHNDYLIEGKNFDGINFGQVKINWGENDNINNSYIDMEIYDKEDNKVLDVRVNYTELIYQNSESYYLDEKNTKDIRYMNIKDGKSCKKEIFRKIRCPLIIIRYYLTHRDFLPIALLTVVIIIFIGEYIIKDKRKIIISLLSILFISFLIYYIIYSIDKNNYDEFIKKIKQ